MQARTLPARHGVIWLLAGFALFRRNPPLLTAISLSYLLLVLVINLVPLIGPFLLPVLLPLLTAMLGNACFAIEQGRRLDWAQLVRHLDERRDAMLRLGGLHLAGSIALVLAGSLLGLELRLGAELEQAQVEEILQKLLMMTALASPLLMAFWFAPLLAAWNNIPATKAVFFSFVASWRNWRAFAAYGVAIAVVMLMGPALLLVLAALIGKPLVSIVAIAVQMFLLFVLAPVLVASVYLSYRDVFHAPRTDVVA